MGYRFNIDNYYAVKKKGNYPWPCASEPKRTIELFTSDVLTTSEDGTFTVHTGICCFGIHLTKKQVTFVKKTAKLQII